ncbi:MAB_1171c family putative transporter [Allokutzneria albata]|uniref:DUF6545 domain-containing protein n=1 Tax=Allokutzneria albata TaxID=211114 RepID=A0A1G9Y7J7_ALLAB|nr:MAB_1171c family putative transporter [Allokutzneria albata]SDN04505.1 hypothetical protein SAMN04489726_4623 [Allokutzneria albata]
MIVLVTTQGALLFMILSWKIVQLARNPTNVPLRYVIVCLACSAATIPLGILIRNTDLTQTTAGYMGYLLPQHILHCTMAYSFQMFFVFSALDGRRARTHAWWQLVPLAVAVMILAGVALVTPDVPPENYPVANIAIFYIASDAYMAYQLCCVMVTIRRYANGVSSRLARGLRMTLAGIVLMLIATMCLALEVVLHWIGLVTPDAVIACSRLVQPGIVIFLVGLVYPGAATRLVTLRVWCGHLVSYHQMRPLWTALHQAFPQDAFRVPRSGWRDRLSLVGVHRRCYRRTIECRDGLVRLSPLIAATRTQPGGSAANLPQQVAAALRAHANNAEGAPVPIKVAVPVGDGSLDADIRELVRLSRGLQQVNGAS